MKVCNEKPVIGHTKFKQGNLYKGSVTGMIYLAISPDKAVLLETGTLYNCLTPGQYEDVTDQYCLQKVK